MERRPMLNEPSESDALLSSRLLDVMIRAGLIAVLAAVCYVVFAPFLRLWVWALVLAVVIYPMQQSVARWMGGRGGLASISLVIVGVLFLVVPTALLMDSFGSSVKDAVDAVQNNRVEIPAPWESVK